MNAKSATERLMYHERNYSEQENVECFKMFNPLNKQNYEFVTDIWRKVKFI
jgi:hypothetical protein